MVGLGLFSQALGWVLITRSLPALPTSVVGLILLLQPSLAFVWDMAIFDRETSLLAGIGVAVTLSAIYLGISGRLGKR